MTVGSSLGGILALFRYGYCECLPCAVWIASTVAGHVTVGVTRYSDALNKLAQYWTLLYFMTCLLQKN